MTTEHEHIDVDPMGDLILDISSPQATGTMRVSSHALALVSPVFRIMLQSPHFQEGRTLQSSTADNPCHISVGDDDHQSLLLAMYAVHHKPRMIPMTLALDEFYQLAVVCDKYDLAEIFLVWVKIWSRSFENTPRQKGCQRWFVISWVFRMSKIFETITKEMIYETSLDGTSIGGIGVEIVPVPDSVLECMAGTKAMVVASLISLATKELELYITYEQQPMSICIATARYYANQPCSNRKACDCLATGALIRGLATVGLWPKPSYTSYTIHEVLKAFQSIEDYSYLLDTSSSGHSTCGPKKRLRDAARRVLDTIEGLKLANFRPESTIFFPDNDQVTGSRAAS